MSNGLYRFDGDGQPTITAVLTASGTFIKGYEPTPAPEYQPFWTPSNMTVQSYEIANPMLVQTPQYALVETAPESFVKDLKAAYEGARLITPEALEGYGKELIRIAERLAAEPINVMLVPYRGGLTPSLHLEVMNKLSYPSIRIGFSRGSHEANWDSIAEEVVAKLNPFKGLEAMHIGVIDAAISGDGSWGLANVLKRVKSHFGKEPWLVTFHLLHPEDEANYPFPEKACDILDLSDETVVFDVVLHSVPSLIVEDWNAAIGLKCKWRNGLCYYKTLTTGHVLSKNPDGSVSVLKSDNLPLVVNSLIAESITDSMLNDPKLKLKQ